MIIGISGKKQSGKNTVAKIIQTITNGDRPDKYVEIVKNNWIEKDSIWQQKQFADKLKDIVCLLIGCSREQLEDNNFKEKELGEEWRVYFWSHYKVKRDSDPNGRLGKLYITKEEVLEEQRKWLPNFEDGEISTYILTPRKLLQLLGTECGRQIIHPQIWVNALISEYKPTVDIIRDGFMPCGTWYIKEKDFNRARDFSKCIEYSKEIATVVEYPNWIITDVRFPNEAKAIEDKDGIVIKIERNFGIEHPKDQHESETALDNHKFKYTILNDGSINTLIEMTKLVLQQLKII